MAEENKSLYRLSIIEADSQDGHDAHYNFSQHTPFPRISVGDNIKFVDPHQVIKVTLVEHTISQGPDDSILFQTIIWTTKVD